MALDEFRAAQKDPRPIVTQVLETLHDDNRERYDDLHAALKDRSITPVAISRVLKNWGFTVNEASVRRYRANHV